MSHLPTTDPSQRRRRAAPIADSIDAALATAPLEGLRASEVFGLAGLTPNRGKMALTYAYMTGRAFRIKVSVRFGGNRYFPTAERAVAGLRLVHEQVEKAMQELAVERAKEKAESKARIKERIRAIRGLPGKQQIDLLTKKPDFHVPKRDTEPVPAAAKPKPKAEKKPPEVVFPKNYKHTVAPTQPDPRYHVDPCHRGEFYEEWLRLRGGQV